MTKKAKNSLLDNLGVRLKSAAQRAPRKEMAEHLKKALLEAFRENGLPEKTILPPNSKLARSAGISHITLRKALSQLEAEKILEQKQGRGTELLKSFKKDMELKGTVALTLPYADLSGQYGDIIDSVGKELAPHKIKLCVSSMEWIRKSSFSAKMDSLLDIDDLIGVLRSPSIYPEEFIEEVNYFQKLDKKTAPVIFLDRQTQVNGLSNVGFDDTNAMSRIFDVVWNRGFREIYFIYADISNLNMRNAERAKGFKLAADKRGYSYDRSFYSLHLGNAEKIATTTVKSILSESDKNIAFICAGEGVGEGIQNALKNEDLKGRKTLVTGFDRIAGVNANGHNFPSTVRSRSEMGKTAAKLLIGLIKKRSLGEHTHESILLEPKVVLEKGEEN